MTPLSSRIWAALGGLTGGTVLGWRGLWSPWAPALALVALAILWGRRLPRLRLLLLFVVAGLAGLSSVHVRNAAPSSLEVLARRVPTCDAGGRVIELSGGLGTLVDVERLSCVALGAMVVEAGMGVVDGAFGQAGSRAEGRWRLIPFGRDGFSAARKRLGAGAELEPLDVRLLPPRGGATAVAASVRGGLLRATEPLPERERALVRGLTIGDTTGFDPGTTELFRRAGLSHLVAVSGSNVAIVLGAASFALRSIGHRWRVALSAAALGLFVLVVGPQPSVLRAAAMGGVALAAIGWGRRTEPLQALGLALMFVIALRPGMVHSVGLHLSAAATAGIVLWTTPLSQRLTLLPAPVALALGATVAAQVAVAPVLVGTFGELSLVAPLANLVAFPAVAPATVLGLAAGLTALVGAPLGLLLARAAAPFAHWILVAASRFGEAPYAAIELPRWVGVLLGMAVVALVARSLRKPVPALV